MSRLTGALQGAGSLSDFGDRLLSELVPMLGGGVAAFYVNDEKGGRLHRAATYGLVDDAGSPDPIQPGEGLIGQCARERKTVSITNLPYGYVRIASGLGQAGVDRAMEIFNDELSGLMRQIGCLDLENHDLETFMIDINGLRP